MQIAAKIVAFGLGLAVLLFFLWPSLGPYGIGKTGLDKTSAAASPTLSTGGMPPQETLKGPTAAPSTLAAPDEAPQIQKASPDAKLTVGEEKQHRLANEQAEAERLVGLVQDHVIKPAPTKRYYKVKVRDRGTLEVGTVAIRLDGIEAREANGNCTDEKGKDWPWGAAARVALTKFIRYRAVSCVLPQGGEQAEYAARCGVGGMDLSTWLVRQGWAKPKAATEPALADASEAAKQAHLGIWRAGEWREGREACPGSAAKSRSHSLVSFSPRRRSPTTSPRPCRQRSTNVWSGPPKSSPSNR